MAEQKTWYLVAYDVRDDYRLKRVVKCIEGYGSRVQYSIFRCRLSERQLEKLRWEISKEMKGEDDLLIIGLCASCCSKVRIKQKDESWFEKPVSFEIL